MNPDEKNENDLDPEPDGQESAAEETQPHDLPEAEEQKVPPDEPAIVEFEPPEEEQPGDLPEAEDQEIAPDEPAILEFEPPEEGRPDDLPETEKQDGADGDLIVLHDPFPTAVKRLAVFGIFAGEGCHVIRLRILLELEEKLQIVFVDPAQLHLRL